MINALRVLDKERGIQVHYRGVKIEEWKPPGIGSIVIRGMGEMQSMLATSLGRIQVGQFTSADYAALADRVQEQVDYVAANCKLPEDADAQLHVVLGEILEGVDAMRAGADRLQGARRVVRALEAYFDHPNWASAAR